MAQYYIFINFKFIVTHIGVSKYNHYLLFYDHCRKDVFSSSITHILTHFPSQCCWGLLWQDVDTKLLL